MKIAAQQQFLHSVWEQTPDTEYAFLARLDRNPTLGSVWHDSTVTPSNHHFNLTQAAGVDLFFTPLGFARAVRSNATALPSRVFFADLDDQFNAKRLNDLNPKYRWETSPGNWQAIWITDRVFERAEWDRINHNLTAYMNADSGGWHASKVLRVPGSMNYKRNGVKVGDLHQYFDVEWGDHITPSSDLFALPGTGPTVRAEFPQPAIPSKQEWAELFRTHWDVLPLGVRSRLMAKAVHDRSLELFMLSKDLLKTGMGHEDAFRLLYGVAYNKFQSRPHTQWKLVLDD